jgi:hypothetical protein
MSVRILGFNAIHSVIKKMFHKGPVAANGACQEIAQEINGREPILSKICIVANVQENVILYYKPYYFGKTCAKT